jgi:hypothetical protein
MHRFIKLIAQQLRDFNPIDSKKKNGALAVRYSTGSKYSRGVTQNFKLKTVSSGKHVKGRAPNTVLGDRQVRINNQFKLKIQIYETGNY